MMDLEKLKALADAATPGPWRKYNYGVGAAWENPVCQDSEMGDDDAAFIAAAREAVPKLTAEVERLRADNARLTSDLVNVQETAKNYAALFHRERSRRRALIERITELSADADDASGP